MGQEHYWKPVLEIRGTNRQKGRNTQNSICYTTYDSIITSSISRPAFLRFDMNLWRQLSCFASFLSMRWRGSGVSTDARLLCELLPTSIFSSYTMTKSILRRPSLKYVDMSWWVALKTWLVEEATSVIWYFPESESSSSCNVSTLFRQLLPTAIVIF